MPNWTRLSAPAAGAFSASWITRIGALILAVVLGGAFLVQSCFSSAPTDPESLIEAEGIAGDRAELELSQRVQDIEHTRGAGRRRRRREPLPSRARNLPAGT